MLFLFLTFFIYISSTNCLKSEEYGFLIDGGSSGTRVNIFSWHKENVLETFQFYDSLKTRPGISSFATISDDSLDDSLVNYFLPLSNLGIYIYIVCLFFE